MNRIPAILIASASSYERQRLEQSLGNGVWKVCGVQDAKEAERACGGHDGASILVIDSGLLLETHADTQWRSFRDRHPEVAAVVRSLGPRGDIRRLDGSTCVVHPSDLDGICQAIHVLHASVTAA